MISNSTPLICLARVNQLELLKKLFKKIIVPEEVKKEVLIENKPGYSVLKEAFSKWIKVRKVDSKLPVGLHEGEKAAISLAYEKNENIILDDLTAIKVAQAYNIPVFRTTTIIIIAVKKNIISKKEGLQLINKLIENGYYISPLVYIDIVAKLQS